MLLRLTIALCLCLLAGAPYPAPTVASSRPSSHAPVVNWHFARQIMQGNANTPTGTIYDPDGDLVSVRVSWGDGKSEVEPNSITRWKSRHADGQRAMPQDMYTVNDPCFNWAGRNRRVIVRARDSAGHVTRRVFRFRVTPDPEWPGPEVPVVEVSPGHDGVIEIGIGS
jgi:hypothetical protein